MRAQPPLATIALGRLQKLTSARTWTLQLAAECLWRPVVLLAQGLAKSAQATQLPRSALVMQIGLRDELELVWKKVAELEPGSAPEKAGPAAQADRLGSVPESAVAEALSSVEAAVSGWKSGSA